MFPCGEQGPIQLPGLEAHDRTGGHLLALEDGSAGFPRRHEIGVHAGLPAAARGALAPIQAHDPALERAALNGEFADVEVAAVAQHGEGVVAIKGQVDRSSKTGACSRRASAPT